MPHGTTESLTLNAGTTPAPAAPQLFDSYFAKYEGEKAMAMDVTFEDAQETVTGSTPVPGLKMSDAPAPEPVTPPVSAPGEQRREAMRLRGATAPASGDSGAKGLMGTVKSAEDAQRLIDRL